MTDTFYDNLSYSDLPDTDSLTETTLKITKTSNGEEIYNFDIKPVRELWYSPDDNGNYGVYKVTTTEEIPHSRLVNHYDFITNTYISSYETTIAGKMQKLNTGLTYSMNGKIIYNKKYKSWQYEPINISQNVPIGSAEQAIYLGSIVTPLQAKTLLDKYPTIVRDIIDGTDNVDLTQLKGIGEKSFDNIKNKIIENFAMADILVFLTPLGVTINKIRKLFAGEPNTELLKQKLLKNPYVLVEIDGITFKQVDNIALKLNPEFLVSEKRTIAFIKNYLQEVGNGDGDTWVGYDNLKSAVTENIVECDHLLDQILEKEIGLENDEDDYRNFLHIEGEGNNQKIGFKYYYDVETRLWEIINELNVAPVLEITEEQFNYGIEMSEKDQGFPFTEEQKEVLLKITKNQFSCVLGYAGVGKSTIARGIMNIYAYSGYMIASATLSAKAAKRLIETTGHASSTIHRLLKATGLNSFTYNSDNKLPHSIILIDECSMINSGLMYHLMSAIDTSHTKIVWVGDNKQLNPISWGNPFHDIIGKENLNINILTKIMRQALDSGIVIDSNKVRQGIDPLNKNYPLKITHGEKLDMYYMFRDSREKIRDIAIKTYLSTVKEIGMENTVLLTPRKSKSITSADEMNKIIQDKLIDDDAPYVQYGDLKYKLNAKIVQIVNNYEKGHYNGDTGFITEIKDMGALGGSGLTITFDNGDDVEYTKAELKEIMLGYSYSVAKFQGSEAHTAIIVLDNTGYRLLNTCLLYCAMTRGKKRVLVVAEPFAFSKAIENNETIERNTWTKFFKEKNS